jgi:hypothetical protein
VWLGTGGRACHVAIVMAVSLDVVAYVCGHVLQLGSAVTQVTTSSTYTEVCRRDNILALHSRRQLCA